MRIKALVLVAFGLVSCLTLADDSFYMVPVEPNEIKIMGYNVQNLFDAEHDEGKEDFQFLPKSSPFKKNCGANTLVSLLTPFNLCTDTDWTAEKVAWKIEQIKFALDSQGGHPDILVLSEVENPKVVGQLAKALNYDGFYMTDSPDIRGIDLAVLFKEDKLEPLNFVEQEVEGVNKTTRNASAAHFRLTSKFGSEILGIYPIHWPSQAGPTSERILAAKTAKDLLNKERRKYSGSGRYHAIALGDFNVVEGENPNPIDSVMLDKSWNIRFKDVHAMAIQQKHPHIGKMPKGTYYYGTEKAWNHFDHMLVSADLTDGRGLEVEVDSYRINAPLSLSKETDSGERIPFRFNHMSSTKRWLGFSDHYAIHAKLTFR